MKFTKEKPYVLGYPLQFIIEKLRFGVLEFGEFELVVP